jgi:hypothetical protein
MNIAKLAQEIADIRFENGHVFEHGERMCEKIGRARAEGLLRALLAHGYELLSHVESPSISNGESEEREIAHSH